MKKEAKFILDKPKAKIETHIFLKFSCIDAVLRYSTQKKIKPEDWDSNLQRAKKNRAINAEIDRLYRIVEKFIESQRLLGKNNFFRDDLKKELDSFNNRIERVSKKKDTNDFNTAVDILLDEAKKGELLTPRVKKIYNKDSLDVWDQGRIRINSFIPDLKFDQVSMETYNKILIESNKKNFSKNYTGNIIKCLKTIMALSHGKGWHNNLIFKDEKFVSIKEKSFQVYLSEAEIKQLYELDLSKNKLWKIVRDRFVINLYNGLRISDMYTLSVDNIQNNRITHVNKKTTKTVVIPVHNLVNNIIKKYDGKMPHQYNTKVVNREIKQIAKAAGLKEKMRFNKTIGGVTVNFVKEKWEMISNHTCRRSMATNILKHVNLQEAMPVLGMGIKTLELYNKITAEDNAKNIESSPFFR